MTSLYALKPGSDAAFRLCGTENDKSRGVFLALSDRFDPMTIAVPPLSPEAMEAHLRLRLPSLHPGRAEDTTFDWRESADGRGRVFLVVAESPTLAAFRQASAPGLIVPAWAAVSVFRKKREFASSRRRIVWTLFPWGFEESEFEADSRFRTHFNLERNGFAEACRRQAADERHADSSYLLICPDDEKSLLGTETTALLGARPRILGFGELAGALGKRDLFFRPGRRMPRLSLPVRIALLLAVAVLGFGGGLAQRALDREAYAANLEMRAATRAADVREVRNLREETESLSRRLDLLQNREGRRPWRVVAALAEVLSGHPDSEGRVELESLRVEGAGFRVEGFAADPLALMEALNADPRFGALESGGISPLQDENRSRFTLSGVFNAQ